MPLPANILQLLADFHPELFLALEYTEEVSSLPSLCSDEQAREQLKKIHYQDLSTLYVYGPGGEAFYSELLPWLKQSPDRRLIFLLSGRSDVEALCRQACAEALLQDSQVALRLFSGLRAVQLLVSEFLCDRTEVFNAYKEKSRKFYALRLAILRKSVLAHAITVEAMKYDKLLGNILPNILHWPRSFPANCLKGEFEGVPAIICGAGPSLEYDLETLRQLGDRALIIAGGSAITALVSHGIVPHLCVAIDPNEEEFERLEKVCHLKSPLIYGTRLEKRVAQQWQGPLGYLKTDTGGPCESYFEKLCGWEEQAIGPEMGMEALSVTTLNVALAAQMGCNPIILSGVDLSYKEGRRYASGVLSSTDAAGKICHKRISSSDQTLRKRNIQGKMRETLVKWVMESESIAKFAKKKRRRTFLNASQEGLGFPGIENVKLSELPLDISYPIQEKLQSLVSERSCSLDRKALSHEMTLVKQSAQKLVAEMQAVIEELKRALSQENFLYPTPLLSLLESEIEEELAFQCLTPHIAPLLDRVIARWHDMTDLSDRAQAERTIRKLKSWKEVLERSLAQFPA